MRRIARSRLDPLPPSAFETDGASLQLGPAQDGAAVAIVGESTTSGLPDELCWVSINPPVCLEVSLVARRHGCCPAVSRMLDSATAIADDLGWL
jgi:hypothetical protein